MAWMGRRTRDMLDELVNKPGSPFQGTAHRRAFFERECEALFQDLLEQARAAAAALRDEAVREAREAGYQAGLVAGLEKGYAQVAGRLNEIVTRSVALSGPQPIRTLRLSEEAIARLVVPPFEPGETTAAQRGEATVIRPLAEAEALDRVRAAERAADPQEPR
jgi:hypothetical protein